MADNSRFDDTLSRNIFQSIANFTKTALGSGSVPSGLNVSTPSERPVESGIQADDPGVIASDFEQAPRDGVTKIPYLDKAEKPAVRIRGDSMAKDLEALHSSIVNYLGTIDKNNNKVLLYAEQVAKEHGAKISYLDHRMTRVEKTLKAYDDKFKRLAKELQDARYDQKKSKDLIGNPMDSRGRPSYGEAGMLGAAAGAGMFGGGIGSGGLPFHVPGVAEVVGGALALRGIGGAIRGGSAAVGGLARMLPLLGGGYAAYRGGQELWKNPAGALGLGQFYGSPGMLGEFQELFTGKRAAPPAGAQTNKDLGGLFGSAWDKFQQFDQNVTRGVTGLLSGTPSSTINPPHWGQSVGKALGTDKLASSFEERFKGIDSSVTRSITGSNTVGGAASSMMSQFYKDLNSILNPSTNGGWGPPDTKPGQTISPTALLEAMKEIARDDMNMGINTGYHADDRGPIGPGAEGHSGPMFRGYRHGYRSTDGGAGEGEGRGRGPTAREFLSGRGPQGYSNQYEGFDFGGGKGGQAELAADREKYAQELKDKPWLMEKMLRIAYNEEGGNPKGVQAIIETAMNRASVRGTDLETQLRWHNAERNGYYQMGNMGREALENPKTRAILEQAARDALAGGNAANYGTDNSSGSLAAGERASGKFTYQTGGDRETGIGDTIFSPGWAEPGLVPKYAGWRKGLAEAAAKNAGKDPNSTPDDAKKGMPDTNAGVKVGPVTPGSDEDYNAMTQKETPTPTPRPPGKQSGDLAPIGMSPLGPTDTSADPETKATPLPIAGSQRQQQQKPTPEPATPRIGTNPNVPYGSGSDYVGGTMTIHSPGEEDLVTKYGSGGTQGHYHIPAGTFNLNMPEAGGVGSKGAAGWGWGSQYRAIAGVSTDSTGNAIQGPRAYSGGYNDGIELHAAPGDNATLDNLRTWGCVRIPFEQLENIRARVREITDKYGKAILTIDENYNAVISPPGPGQNIVSPQDFADGIRQKQGKPPIPFNRGWSKFRDKNWRDAHRKSDNGASTSPEAVKATSPSSDFETWRDEQIKKSDPETQRMYAENNARPDQERAPTPPPSPTPAVAPPAPEDNKDKQFVPDDKKQTPAKPAPDAKAISNKDIAARTSGEGTPKDNERVRQAFKDISANENRKSFSAGMQSNKQAAASAPKMDDPPEHREIAHDLSTGMISNAEAGTKAHEAFKAADKSDQATKLREHAKTMPENPVKHGLAIDRAKRQKKTQPESRHNVGHAGGGSVGHKNTNLPNGHHPESMGDGSTGAGGGGGGGGRSHDGDGRPSICAI